MDPAPPITDVNKPSSLPRPSRLPTLSKRPSQIFPPKQQNVVGPTKPSVANPRLQNRGSVASIPRTGQREIKELTALSSRTTSSRQNVPQRAKTATNGSRSTQPSAGRPLSRDKRSRDNPAPAFNATANEGEEKHDQLSSLDSFRTGSRQGFNDDSPTEPQAYAEPTDLPKASTERKKSSRPSLSDRTVESLQQLPSTPKERRQSNFFSPVESSMRPPPRPSSSLSRTGSSSSSRPGTSDGDPAKPVVQSSLKNVQTPASGRPTIKSLGGFGFAPSTANRRSISSAFTSKLHNANSIVPPIPRSPSPQKREGPPALPNGNTQAKTGTRSRTVAARPSKPRPALADAFGPAVRQATSPDEDGRSPAKGSSTHLATPRATKRTVSNPSNSSAALREQIAAAKVAARKEKVKRDSHSPLDNQATPNRSSGDSLHTDPFNQFPKDNKHILRNRINSARMDGRLNIAAMRLKSIPDEVLIMYTSAAMEESKINWAEVVDLTRLNAADNEIEDIDDAVFPDASAEELSADDQTEGNQFNGLEVLDLHGNSLRSLPLGLRRLDRLTSLNLAYNKLDNSAIEVIADISSLKELRLGHNALSGQLSIPKCSLPYLELLDVQANRLLELPSVYSLVDMMSLKVLNVSGNQLTALPMDALEVLGLVELDASSNALIGSLFPPRRDETDIWTSLQTLKASNNSLAALTFSEELGLPQLRTLDVTNNHLTGLPPLSSWSELLTLTAGDNKITEIPPGFTSLRKLRNVNFTGNELRLLDPEIARMEGLESLILAANPLREKKFLTMSAGDIKRDLRQRLDENQAESNGIAEQYDSNDAQAPLAPSAESPTSSWTLKANSTLDLAGRGLSDEVNDSLGSFLRHNEVKQLHLQMNKLTAVPPALWLGQSIRVLDLSGSALAIDYLYDDLEMPALQELSVNRCNINTLEPLMTQLQAPNLHTLNVSLNRLTGSLPTLRKPYPALTTLLASDNKFMSLTAESLRGLHTVNLASNNIAQLPAEVGLLWHEGLRSLEVGSNAFRVPNYRVLEKGTEAVCRWLRDRLPMAQNESTVNGDAGFGD